MERRSFFFGELPESTSGRVFVSITALPFWCLMMYGVWSSPDLGVWWRLILAIHATIVCWGGGLGVMHLTATMKVQERRERGACLACGYDLRASRHTCPECGTPRGQLPRGARPTLRELAQRAQDWWSWLNGY